MDTSNETQKVNEEELEQVAGGVGAAWDCWFQSAGWVNQLQEPGFEFTTYICGRSSCFEGLSQCACHGTDRCVGRMHKMDKASPAKGSGPGGFGAGHPGFESMPYPKDQYNHKNLEVRFWTK